MSTEIVLYKETQEFPFRRGLFFLFFLMFASIPVFLDIPWWMSTGILLIGLLVAALIHSFMIMRVEITREHFHFGYWVSAPKVTLQDIQHIEVVDIPKMAGAGIHRWREYWVYNANWGRGLKVHTAKKKYMVGSDSPEQLHSALKDVIRRKPVS